MYCYRRQPETNPTRKIQPNIKNSAWEYSANPIQHWHNEFPKHLLDQAKMSSNFRWVSSTRENQNFFDF